MEGYCFESLTQKTVNDGSSGENEDTKITWRGSGDDNNSNNSREHDKPHSAATTST